MHNVPYFTSLPFCIPILFQYALNLELRFPVVPKC